VRRLAEFDIDFQLESQKLARHLQDRVYDKRQSAPACSRQAAMREALAPPDPLVTVIYSHP
jgi:hypothetical protein